MGKRKKEGKKFKKIIIVIIAIIALLFVAYKATDFITVGRYERTNLVINNNNVTVNLKNDLIIKDNQIYISKPDLANFFDNYIYEDTDNNQIITSYKTKIATVSLKNNNMTINGSNKVTKAHAIKENNTIYLPIKELKDVYGINVEYNNDTNILILDSIAREQKKAIAKNTLPVKQNTRFLSKTLERVEKGNYVVVVSEEDGKTKIRTENGNVGYVKSNQLANTVVVRQQMEEQKQIEGKVNLVWDYYSEYATAPTRTEKLEGVNIVAPSFFYLDSNGELQQNIGTSGEAYIKWAHNNGFKIWPIISNAEARDINVTSKIMNSYNKRQALIEEIVTACVKYQLDGINIDFEYMKKEDKDMFSRFIIELTPRIKDMGMTISVDTTAPDGGDNYSLCYDRHVIGDVADYIVFMAYDEYGASSNKAGTTAGYNWIKIGLNKYLTTEEIESDKIILAVPLYARLWTTNKKGRVIKQSSISMKNFGKIIPKNATKKWDDDLKQYYVEYKENGYTKKIWIENEKSLKEKIALIKENNLAGVGSWAKDMETKNYWDFLKNELQK